MRELNVACTPGASRHTHVPGTCDSMRVTRTGPSTRRTGDTATRQVTVRSRVKRVETSRVRRPAHTIQIKNMIKKRGRAGAVLTPRVAHSPQSCRHTAGHRADTSHTQYPCNRSRSSRRRLCPVYRSMPAPNGMPSGCRAHSSAHTHDNHPLTSSRPSSRPRTRIHAIAFM